MLSSTSPKTILLGVVIFLAYLSVSIFGLIQFSHLSEAPMPHCPYTQNNSALCMNSFDHVNNWRQFSNVPFLSLWLFLLLGLGLILYFFNRLDFSKQKVQQWKYYLDNKKLFTPLYKITSWLSLLENSPSVSF